MFLILRMPDGTTHRLEALEGWRVMEVIRDWGLPIKAECGGACACATCHVYVDPEWLAAAGAPDDIEDALLDMVDSRAGNSRLSCKIKLRPELDGLKVTVGPTS